MSDEKPKLIVDEDWKNEANREKEKLAAQQAEAAKAKAEQAAKPIEFSDVVRLMASQAAMYLGVIPEPQSQQRILAPDMAKTHIDILGVLEEKTKGNLSEEESEQSSRRRSASCAISSSRQPGPSRRRSPRARSTPTAPPARTHRPTPRQAL